MKRVSQLAFAGCAAVLLLCAAPAVHGQNPQSVIPPIVVKQPKPKKLKYKGFVIHANRLQITVRSVENERMVRTFRLSPELQEKMQQIIDQGGYQHGDKVEIHHVDGTDLALKIKGKPSKPPR
jgi:hypothetical protein